MAKFHLSARDIGADVPRLSARESGAEVPPASQTEGLLGRDSAKKRLSRTSAPPPPPRPARQKACRGGTRPKTAKFHLSARTLGADVPRISTISAGAEAPQVGSKYPNLAPTALALRLAISAPKRLALTCLPRRLGDWLSRHGGTMSTPGPLALTRPT